jgi:formylglycine-generating enzyme required for sulfatase activity
LQNARERTWPVGSKKPNDLGLFDMHGNVFAWCQDRAKPYPQAEADKVYDDVEDSVTINYEEARPARGGAFTSDALDLDSGKRHFGLPTRGAKFVGFRPARTIR